MSWKYTQCRGERKEKLFLLKRELGVGRDLKVNNCGTESTEKGSEECLIKEGKRGS